MGDASLPQWKGLFDWSMRYQDGTRPTDFASVAASEEKVRWLETVLKEYMTDFVTEMQNMQADLQRSATSTASSHDIARGQELLDELHDVVENIDYARDLQTVGGLPTLRTLIQNSTPGLQWRALDVLAACCQNHITVQDWFYKEGILEDLIPLLGSADPSVRKKALLAVSSLVRGHAEALREYWVNWDGLLRLQPLLKDENEQVAVKALHFAKNICSAYPPKACTAMAAQGWLIDSVAASLTSSNLLRVSAALGLLKEMIDIQRVVQELQAHAALMQSLPSLRARLQGLTIEEREALAEEIQWCDEVISALQEVDD